MSTALQAVLLVALVGGAIWLFVWAGGRWPFQVGTPDQQAELSRARAAVLAVEQPLGWRDRWQVRRAVRRGRAVSDLSLAGAAVVVAQSTVRTRRAEPAWTRWGQLVGPSLLLLSVVLRMTSSSYTHLRFFDVAALVVFSSGIAYFLFGRQWSIRHAERAELLNSRLIP